MILNGTLTEISALLQRAARVRIPPLDAVRSLSNSSMSNGGWIDGVRIRTRVCAGRAFDAGHASGYLNEKRVGFLKGF